MAEQPTSSKELSSIADLCKEIQKAVIAATKGANSIPLVDFALYRTYPAFAKVMNFEKKSIGYMINNIFKHENLPHKFNIKGTDEEMQDAIIDFNDLVLDRVGNQLDEFEGLKRKNEELIIAALGKTAKVDSPNRKSLGSWNKNVQQLESKKANILAGSLQKPQLQFKESIDNSNQIFRPILKYKHNSIKPLALMEEFDDKGQPFFPNPYEAEIAQLKILPEQLMKKEPKKYGELQDTQLTYIDQIENLKEMLNTLLKETEFAVDLEFHSYRSFLGFTCLMQISTRTQDFIIDTLALRDELHILNEAFTHPKILKVFHGAEWDIVWLQKDFGIYVVNMFDTGQAARLLKLPYFSLAFLVKNFCDVNLNKEYQLADWRTRPLSEDMLLYARQDTHYLLYIKDILQNKLIDGINQLGNLITLLYKASGNICARRYEKPLVTETSHVPLMAKSQNALNSRQENALRALFLWRDALARKEDESTLFILPNHMMLKIAEVLPREMQGILACCNPIPVMVRRYLSELHQIVLKARDLPLEEIQKRGMVSKKISTQITDLSSQMDTLHEEVRDGLEYLLDGSINRQVNLTRTKKDWQNQSIIGFLSREDEKDAFCLKELSTYLSPYKLYCAGVEKKKIADKETQEKEEDQSSQMEVDDGEWITHSKKRPKLETDYEKIMISHPIKDLMKKDKKKVVVETSHAIDELLNEAKQKVQQDKDSIDSQTGVNEVDFVKADLSIFSKEPEKKANYFDPTEEYRNQKQKNKNFTSRTKRKKDIQISSSSIKKFKK